MGAAAACRPEGPLELRWDEVCVLSTTEPATLACYEPKRRDLNLKPRRVPSHIRGSLSDDCADWPQTLRFCELLRVTHEKPLLVKGN